MFKVADIEQKTFTGLEELREHLALRERRRHEMPLKDITLDESGVLRGRGAEGELTGPAATGLLRALQIPEHFARGVCPSDLLIDVVRRLAGCSEIPVWIQSMDGLVTAVYPSTRTPVSHDDLIDWIGPGQPIKEAILAGDSLRIIGLQERTSEVLPGDIFGTTWEVMNSEGGWRSLEARRYLIRKICSNGMVGFDKTATFVREPTSKEPVTKSLEQLTQLTGAVPEIRGLEQGIEWAQGRQIGADWKPVARYLAGRLEGKVTELLLESVTEKDSLYDLLNRVTALARNREFTMRRRYEQEGGMLLQWFLARGRGRPAWRSVPCEACTAFTEADPTEN
jgi:hypothetical protein